MNPNEPTHPAKQAYTEPPPQTARPCDEEVWLKGLEIIAAASAPMILKAPMMSEKQKQNTGEGMIQFANDFLSSYKARWP